MSYTSLCVVMTDFGGAHATKYFPALGLPLVRGRWGETQQSSVQREASSDSASSLPLKTTWVKVVATVRGSCQWNSSTVPLIHEI